MTLSAIRPTTTFRASVAVAVIALLLAAGFGASASAQDGAYLDAMPPPGDIEAAFPIAGPDRIDAAARQRAAFGYVTSLIDAQTRRRSDPTKLTPREERVYKTYGADADQRIRKAMGFPGAACGANRDCRRYDSLTTDYMGRSKKKRALFQQELTQKLPIAAAMGFPGPGVRVIGGARGGVHWPYVILAIGLGVFAARPWKAVYRGPVTQLGSGFVRTTPGLINQTVNRRNRITIGAKKLGETFTSPRMDDALVSAMQSGGEAAVGAGWVLWRRWILSVKCNGETDREPVLSFLMRTLILSPLVAVVGGLAAGYGAKLVLPGALALPVGLFVFAFGVSQIAVNILAWLGGAPASAPAAYAN